MERVEMDEAESPKEDIKVGRELLVLGMYNGEPLDQYKYALCPLY